ncbi:protein SpAN-like [Ylistrum balloti]|uniref:protein SpAN-like n=1 Tax=Ylistrum balloti TaxID=509963 RepID=UPI002905CFAA|nr:protein SpAN-like [Ylistrum balloti]
MVDRGSTTLFLVGILVVLLTPSVQASSNSDFSASDEDVLEKLIQLLKSVHKQEDNGYLPSKGKQPKIDYDSLHPIKESAPEQASEEKKNFKESTILWEKGRIPYTFQCNISEGNRIKVRTMMDKLEEYSCIKWEFVSPGSTEYHVLIEDKNGCQSPTGNIKSSAGFQILSLDQSLCMNNGTILHELSHTIGMEHELSRPDRDNQIILLWDNIPGGMFNPNIKMKDDLRMFATPFDITSIMQYTAVAMTTRKGTLSYKTKDANLIGLTLEDRHDLSFYDKLLINRAYDCAGRCHPKSCKNGEFLDKNCTCLCPDGLTGESCESVIQDDNYVNNGSIVIGSIGEKITVNSSGYPNTNYPTGSICRWLIEGPKGSKLHATIRDMDIVSSRSSDNVYCIHWLEIRYNLIAQPGPEFCGDNGGQVTTIETADYSESNKILMNFDTTNEASSVGHRGFSLEFVAVEGNNATKPVDFCRDVNCQNGGTCNSNDNNYWCSCVAGFMGRNCERTSSVQNDQNDINTVFHCDNTATDQCELVDLGTAWEIDDSGRFVVKPQQQAPVHLPIHYNVTQPDQQYCFHFKISRPISPEETTCSELTFIVSREEEYPGFTLEFDDYLLFDDDCTEKTDFSEMISFTSHSKITGMEFLVDNLPDSGADIALSDFELQSTPCS